MFICRHNGGTKNEETAEKEINLLETEIKDENVALNVLVAFINAAQREGFSIPESAKIWECIQKFQKNKIYNNQSYYI